MEITFKVLLFLHVIGGGVGLLSGTINLIRKKGDKNHRLAGRIFVYSMVSAGVSSLILSVLHPNYFLFMVGVFTLYMTLSGNRYLYLKQLGSEQKPKLLDWAISIAMLLSGLLFIGIGIWFLSKSNYFGLVYAVFGCLGMLFVREDFQNYKGKSELVNYWLTAHISRMTGAYIASLTAFLVVNGTYLPVQIPAFVLWLIPTIFVVPFIIKWSKKYEIKKSED